MFARLSALILAVPFLVSASVVPRTGWGGNSVNQCNGGSIQCCNNVEAPSSSTVQEAAGLLGLVSDVGPLLVGLDCTPITALDAGSNACSAQTVCCTNSTFSGVIALGCMPINIL